MVILSLNPLPGAALLQFPLPITFAAVDRLLGGTGDAASPKRPLTEIEQNLMRSVVDRALRELEYAYETLVRVEAEIVQQEFNPQFAQIAAPSDMVLVVSFEMRIGEKRGNATICVPFTTMAPVLESLASQTLFQDQRGEDPVLWQQKLESALYTVPVETRVRFDAVGLTSAEIVVPAGRRHRAARSPRRPAGSASPSTTSVATTASPADAASVLRRLIVDVNRDDGWR